VGHTATIVVPLHSLRSQVSSVPFNIPETGDGMQRKPNGHCIHGQSRGMMGGSNFHRFEVRFLNGPALCKPPREAQAGTQNVDGSVCPFCL